MRHQLGRIWAAGLCAVGLCLGPAIGWSQGVIGTVWSDENGNGVIDAGDQPVAGVMVIVENLSGTFSAAYSTAADGFFAISVGPDHVPDSFICRLNPNTMPSGAAILIPDDGMFAFQLTADGDERKFEEADFLIGEGGPPPEGEEPAPPGRPADDCPKLTGGGWIIGTPSGAKGTFSVQAGIRRGEMWGGLNYIDHDTGMHVRSRTPTSVEFDPADNDCLIITYDVLIDGEPGEALVRACDKGEPGRNDIFEIALSNGYAAGGTLGGDRRGGGNIQMHKCPPGWHQRHNQR